MHPPEHKPVPMMPPFNGIWNPLKTKEIVICVKFSRERLAYVFGEDAASNP
jgi:hypothetical protein